MLGHVGSIAWKSVHCNIKRYASFGVSGLAVLTLNAVTEQGRR